MNLFSKTWVQLLLVAIIAAGSSWAAWSWRGAIAHVDQIAAVDAQRLLGTQQCEAEKDLTEEVDNAYQSTIADLNRRVADLKRVRPGACIPVVSAGTGQHDAATQNKGLPASHGITADALIDFARDAEEVGLQLDALQEFERRRQELQP